MLNSFVSTLAYPLILGSLSDMPAVNTFALYSTAALFFDFVLQITAFIALMSIDMQRSERNRLDLFCCIKTKVERVKKDSGSLLQKMFEKYYTPFLLSK